MYETTKKGEAPFVYFVDDAMGALQKALGQTLHNFTINDHWVKWTANYEVRQMCIIEAPVKMYNYAE